MAAMKINDGARTSCDGITNAELDWINQLCFRRPSQWINRLSTIAMTATLN